MYFPDSCNLAEFPFEEIRLVEAKCTCWPLKTTESLRIRARFQLFWGTRIAGRRPRAAPHLLRSVG